MEERREHERHATIVGSDIGSQTQETEFGLTRDISAGGAKLLTMELVESGTKVLLRVPVGADPVEVVEVKANIVHCKPVTDRGMWAYEVGISFEGEVDANVINKMCEMADGLKAQREKLLQDTEAAEEQEAE